MVVDYVTGMAKAYMASQLSSRIGLRGILKKLCYMAMVAVGAALDYLLTGALAQAGIDYACRQLQDLKEHGVDGLHVYTMNRPSVASAAMQALGR